MTKAKRVQAQAETVDMLLSYIDNLNVVEDEYSTDGALVFDGDGVDGPCVGYINPDGTVSWMANGGFHDRDMEV